MPPVEPTSPASEPLRAAVAIRAARAKLNAPPSVGSSWSLVGAAALAAVSALAFAFAVIMGPPQFGPDVTVTKATPLALRPLQ